MGVTYLDSMGTDLSIVNAARVSFDKESDYVYPLDTLEGLNSGSLSDKDVKLIGYLAKHNHWSPFAHTSIQLRIKAPIFVARQLVKHQVGLTWSEVSRRYVDSPPEFYFPDVWRSRPDGAIKQGSGDEHPSSASWATAVELHLNKTALLYDAMIADGVAPEQARMVLPQNMMTEWWWTGSLMAFCRICRERLAPGAQAETREVAERIAEIVAPLFPVGWSALMGEKA
jgi:thymidylate synthase (FAD)